MSIKLMTWVWDNADVNGTTLLVLLALADKANDRGYCWPSINTIAKQSRISRRQAIRVLKELEETGFIEVERRKEEADHNLTNMYRVVTPMSLGSVTGDTRVVTPMSPKPSVNLKYIEDEEKASSSSRQHNHLSVEFFLEQFSAKRLNNAQIETLVGLEEQYGLQETKNWITWAARRSMPISRAIPAIHSGMEKKQPTKIKQKTTTEGSGFF